MSTSYLNNSAFLKCVGVSITYPLDVGGGFNKILCPPSYQYVFVQINGNRLSDKMIYSDTNGNEGSVGVPCAAYGLNLPINDIYKGQYLPCATSFKLTFPGTQGCTTGWDQGRNSSMSFVAFCNKQSDKTF